MDASIDHADTRRAGPWGRVDSKFVVTAALLVAILVVLLVLAPSFFRPNNLVNVLVQTSSLGLMAVGMAPVMIAGGIDLSLPANMALGAVLIAIDEGLGRMDKIRLPPLGVAMGIYLPAGTISTVVAGALAGHYYDRWVEKGPNPEMAKRLGVIMASGLIVGESLFSVALAAAISASKTGLIKVADSDFPLGLVGDAFEPYANILAFVFFIIGGVGLYRWVAGLVRKPG